MTDSKFNVLGIVAVLGALLMIVGVFLSWVDITGSIVGFENTESMSGWDIVGEEDADKLFEYSFAPLTVLVLGILCLIFTAIPMVKVSNFGKILGALALLMAIVAVILSVLFMTDVSGEIGVDLIKTTSSAGTGLYLSLVGGILVVIGGMLNLVKKTA